MTTSNPMNELNKLAPYPTREQDVTADALARVMAVTGQGDNARIFPTMYARDNAEGTPEFVAMDLIHAMTMAGAVQSYTIVHLLRTLQEIAPDKADEVAKDVWNAWEDGGAIGEWLYEWLTEYGIDPAAVADIARQAMAK